MSISTSFYAITESLQTKMVDLLGGKGDVYSLSRQVFLGVASFFAAYQADKALQNYFFPLPAGQGQALPWHARISHYSIEQVCYSFIMKTPPKFFSSATLNRILQVSRFCIAFLLGATAARSLGMSSKALPGQFSTDIVCGFCWAVCREAALWTLPTSISSSLLVGTDGIVSTLVEVCPVAGQSVSNSEWYCKALSRGIFQILAEGSRVLTGSHLPAFVQHTLFNVTRML